MGIPRESIEFISVDMTVDGATTQPTSISVVEKGDRPTVWVSPIVLEGLAGFLTTGYPPGTFAVYARVSDAPETPVVHAGTFTID